MKLAIYCADIGSVPNARFGWARTDPNEPTLESHRGGTEIVDFVNNVAEDLGAPGRIRTLSLTSPLRNRARPNTGLSPPLPGAAASRRAAIDEAASLARICSNS
jgi:hypothetical protein